MIPDETNSSSATAGGEAEAKETAPVKPKPASKSKGTAKASKAKPYGEIRINDTTTVRYDKAGSKSMSLPKPRETPKTVG